MGGDPFHAHAHAPGDGHGHDGESHIQASLEKSARLSRVAFNAPPTLATYGFIVLASALFGLLLDFSARGPLLGFLALGVPALIAGPLSAPLAILLGGTLYYKRAAFLAAVGVASVGAVLLLGLPFRLLFDAPVSVILLLGYMGLTGIRHASLYFTSDNRHLRTLPVTLLQTAVALPFIAVLFGFGRAELVLTALLPFVFLVPLVFFLHIFDAPLQRNFKVSASELFRFYLDHLTSGRLDGEAILSRFAEPIQAKFAVAAFRRRDGTVKAAMVVPALHPGPIGRLGGSDLPGKVREAVKDVEYVLVPHGPATHDYNPVSTADVERFGRAVGDVLSKIEYQEGGSKAVSVGAVKHGEAASVRVTSQLFGNGALLTYTSHPSPIDDVDYGVGHAAELAARNAGIGASVFVDCHNSLKPGSGAVFLCTPRADAIIASAQEATRAALDARVPTVRVGCAQDARTFAKKDGIGDQGLQVLAIEAGGEKHAYVLWDGNNAVPEVTTLIGKELAGLVDSYQVMTTDNHSVNAVAGAYGPVGHLAPPARIAQATRLAVEKALQDLEPVQTGFASATIPDFLVYGNQKTVQLTAAINTMTSVVVELVVATVALQIMGTALLFWALGVL